MKSDLTFEQQLAQSIQHTVIDFIRKGDWLKLDYNASDLVLASKEIN